MKNNRRCDSIFSSSRLSLLPKPTVAINTHVYFCLNADVSLGKSGGKLTSCYFTSCSSVSCLFKWIGWFEIGTINSLFVLSFSYDRKEPQRNRNTSEGEYFGRKKEEEYHRPGNEPAHKSSNDSANTDGYLSWRRNKAPSPSRTRLGIMPRNNRSDHKFDNRGISSGGPDRLNKSKINSRITELPSVVKEQGRYCWLQTLLIVILIFENNIHDSS